MKSKTTDTLNQLESYIKEKSYSLSIFKGYTAVNKRGVEKLIDTLYANLPDDVKQAREYLKSLDANYSASLKAKNSTIYDNIKELEEEMDVSISFTQYAIININKIEQIIDKIYDSIPEEITKAEKLSK